MRTRASRPGPTFTRVGRRVRFAPRCRWPAVPSGGITETELKPISRAWWWWPAAPGADVGCCLLERLVRRHCVAGTSESFASLLGLSGANRADGRLRLAPEIQGHATHISTRPRSIFEPTTHPEKSTGITDVLESHCQQRTPDCIRACGEKLHRRYPGGSRGPG